MNGVHDMGGTHGRGRIVRELNEPAFHHPWEGRVRGMAAGLLGADLFNLDEFRHAQERLAPDVYLRSSYYERWLNALELLVREKDVAIRSEPLAETRAPARFAVGDRVITRNIEPPGHTRLPRYARAKRGVIDAVRGPYLLPDTHAHQGTRDWEPVYTVVFSARELWAERAGPKQSVSVDLWQSYLEEDV